MLTHFSWRRWLLDELHRHRFVRTSCGRRSLRGRSRRAPVHALESLETRVLLDAAPYVVDVELSGVKTAYGEKLVSPGAGVLFDVTQSHLLTMQNTPNIVPDTPYEIEEWFESPLTLGTGTSAASAVVNIGGVFWHTDEERSVGQPEIATLYLEGEVIASGAFDFPFFKENGEPDFSRPRRVGSAAASLMNTATARISIWDADCGIVGIPVTGEWELESRLGVLTSQPFPGGGSLDQEVVIRYWKAVNETDPLVLDSTITVPLPVGHGVNRSYRVAEAFELTTGSEIEIEIRTQATATSNATADINDLQFQVTINPPDFIDLHEFAHYTTSAGEIDPQWIAVEYEVTQPICYFDLELGSVAEGGTVPTTFETFRITPEIIENDPRFRLANPSTGEIEPALNATAIGRHLLLIDSNDATFKAAFESLENERIVVYEPKQAEDGVGFHGFYQAAVGTPLVVRSDGDLADEIIMDGTTVEFNGDQSYSFVDLLTHELTTDQVIAITGQGNDLVLAGPEFELPIRASLGAGNDVFVGGRGADEARGGKGNDVLLGEGWVGVVTDLKDLFLDMLDLNFTLQAGLVPAEGAGDTLYGEEGDDFLLGGDGNDTLESGPGQSIIFGDSLKVLATITVDFEDLKFGADIDFVRSGAGADTIKAGDDHTLVMGGGGNDKITGNTVGISLLFGNGGDDEIIGQNSFALLVGGAGDDHVEGSGILIGDSFDFSTFSNTGLDGLKQGKLSVGFKLTSEDSGSDTIFGEDGFDFIIGGDGDDVIHGGDGLNIVFCDGFDLSLSIGLDFKSLFSFEGLKSIAAAPLAILDLFHFEFELTGSGNDEYYGGSGTDVVFGGAGDDKLYGNLGFDILVGGEGHDEVNAGDGWLDWLSRIVLGDIAVGGPGNDVITGGNGPDFLASEGGDDVFYGLGGDDVIFGGPDNDTIYGGSGNDRLYGEGGDDQIFGDDGDDALYGGQGNDSFDPGGGNSVVYPDEIAPQVMAIVPSAGFANPTTAADLEFTVAFDTAVSGIDVGDFTVATTGTATGAIAAVSHTGGKWVKVSVTSVSGLGTLGLIFDPAASGSVTSDSGMTATQGFTGSVFNVGTQFAPAFVDFPDSAVDFQEGGPAVLIGGGTVEDLDLLDFDGGTLTVAIIGAATADDHLSIQHAGHAPGEVGIDGQTVTYGVDGTSENALPIASFSGGEGTAPLIVTFNANAHAQHVTRVLQAIAFSNDSTTPATAPRTVGFEVTDGDGGTSDVVTRTVNILAINDAPVVTTSGSVVNFTEGDVPVVIDNTVTVFDADSENFDGGTVTVTIATGSQPSDRLGIASSEPISVNASTSEVSYDGQVIGVLAGTTTLTVALNSNATLAAVEALLQHVTFSNISAAPSATPRTVTFVVTDGDGGTSSAAPAATVTVTPVNDAPTDIVLSKNTVAENRPIGTTVGLLASVDPDAMPGEIFTYALVDAATYPDNQFFAIGAGGSLITAETFDYDVQNTLTISVRSTDAGGLSVDKTFVIHVTEFIGLPTDIPFGTTIEGEITAPGQSQQHTFTLAGPQFVYFDGIEVSDHFAYFWTLTGPSGDLASGWAGDGYAVYAPIAGAYTLTISMDGDATGPYSFRLLDLAAAVPLVPGAPVSGTLDPADSTHAYQLLAEAGDRLFFDSHADNPQNASWHLLDPLGQYVTSGWLGSDADVPVLTLPGTYTLLIEGPSFDSGATEYGFTVQSFGASSSPLTLGALVEGEISIPGEIDLYTWTLSGPATLYFDSLGDASYLWTVTGPNGQAASGWSGFDYAFFAPIAGEYTVTIDMDGDATGSYAFRLLDLSTGPVLTLGAPVSGTLDPASRAHTYRFTANAGDSLFFDSQTDDAQNAIVHVLDPLGQYVASNWLGSDVDLPVLTFTGTYTLLIEGPAFDVGTTSYGFELQFLGNIPPDEFPGTPLPLGSTVEEELSTEGEVDDYVFSVAGPGWLYFDGLGEVDYFAYSWTVTGPHGYVTSNLAGANEPFFAPLAGEYQLSIAADTGHGPTSYVFRLLDLSQATPLTPGVPVGGTLAPASATHAYRFTAHAGERLFFDTHSASPQNAGWRLLDPLGQSVAASWMGNDGDIPPLTLTGTYTLLIEGLYLDAGATDYEFTVHAFDDAGAALTLGALTNDASTVPGDNHQYTFTLGGPAYLYFDSLDEPDYSAYTWTVTGPHGYVTSNSAGANEVFFAPIAGQYTLTIDWNGDATGAYTFRLLDLSAATPLILGTPRGGTLDPASATHAYRFTADAGATLLLDSHEENPQNASWRLLDPLGQVMAGNWLGGDTELPVLTLAGTYTLLIEGPYFDVGVTAYSFTLLSDDTTVVANALGAAVNGGDANRSGIRELTIEFDQAVSVASAGVLALFNHTTGQSVDVSGAALVGNGTTSITWVLADGPGGLADIVLPDGRYTAELAAGDTTPGLAQSFAFEFHKLAGDVDGDGLVNFNDYFEVRQNFDTFGLAYRPGDGDGDGLVNFNDYFAVRENFDAVLPALAFDFGDAPTAAQSGFAASDPTTLAADGARHVVTGNALILGISRDAESNGQPHATTSGDHNVNSDDENGVTIGDLDVGTTVGLTVMPNGEVEDDLLTIPAADPQRQATGEPAAAATDDALPPSGSDQSSGPIAPFDGAFQLAGQPRTNVLLSDKEEDDLSLFTAAPAVPQSSAAAVSTPIRSLSTDKDEEQTLTTSPATFTVPAPATPDDESGKGTLRPTSRTTTYFRS
ncbi:MAG: hypothetical protein KF861_02635 [Planctomycetaceae bacterium]|nr:hypothetical protein [Planctomycetaceae bacterium]